MGERGGRGGQLSSTHPTTTCQAHPHRGVNTIIINNPLITADTVALCARHWVMFYVLYLFKFI